MNEVVAVVLIRQQKQLEYLGHMPLIRWNLRQIEAVRGIDRVIYVVKDDLLEQVKNLVGCDSDIFAIPKKLKTITEHSLQAWLTAPDSILPDCKIMLICTGTSPFLSAGNMESCIKQVAKGKFNFAQPGREVVVFDKEHKKIKSIEVVESVRVLRTRVPESERLVTTVKVSLIESLNVNDHDHYVIVDALVASHKL